MNLLNFFRGLPQVASQEFVANLKSVRLIIMVAILALAVVGGAYGLSGGTAGDTLPPLEVWGHAAFEADGSHLAALFVSNPFGTPLGDVEILFSSADPQLSPTGPSGDLGTVRTNPSGFARFAAGNRTEVYATARIGSVAFHEPILWGAGFPAPALNFTWDAAQYDFARDGTSENFAVHVLNRAGDPIAASILVDQSHVREVDSNGYAQFDVPVGNSNVTIQAAGETITFTAIVFENPFASLFGTPDATLFFLSAFFLYLIVPIFAIVVTFDAVSKERVQGTLDLLLSRPVSRSGVLLGKFLGAFLAVAFPVSLVNLAGIGVITAVSGRAPSGPFAAAFLSFTLLLIAFYVLLQLIFSTLAKTSGTAVLFGVLVWLLFNILYNILVLVISLAIPSPEGRLAFQSTAGLGNPSSIYQQLVVLYAPLALSAFGGGAVLNAGVLGAAATVWLVALLVLALWIFEKRAAAG